MEGVGRHAEDSRVVYVAHMQKSERTILTRHLHRWMWDRSVTLAEHLLPPSFIARVAYAIRGAVGISIAAAILVGISTIPAHTAALMPVAFIICILVNLGASMTAAANVCAGAASAAAYCVIAVSILPQHMYAAFAAITVWAAAVSCASAYVSVLFLRFSVGTAVLVMLSWYGTPMGGDDARRMTGEVLAFVFIG